MYLTVWLISPEMKKINTNFSIVLKKMFSSTHTHPILVWVVSYHDTVRFCKNHPTTPIIVHIAFQYYCNSLFSPLRPMGSVSECTPKKASPKVSSLCGFQLFSAKKEKKEESCCCCCCCCLCTTQQKLNSFLKKVMHCLSTIVTAVLSPP
jgi:hypothetical protein